MRVSKLLLVATMLVTFGCMPQRGDVMARDLQRERTARLQDRARIERLEKDLRELAEANMKLVNATRSGLSRERERLDTLKASQELHVSTLIVLWGMLRDAACADKRRPRPMQLEKLCNDQSKPLPAANASFSDL